MPLKSTNQPTKSLGARIRQRKKEWNDERGNREITIDMTSLT